MFHIKQYNHVIIFESMIKKKSINKIKRYFNHLIFRKQNNFFYIFYDISLDFVLHATFCNLQVK